MRRVESVARSEVIWRAAEVDGSSRCMAITGRKMGNAGIQRDALSYMYAKTVVLLVACCVLPALFRAGHNGACTGGRGATESTRV